MERDGWMEGWVAGQRDEWTDRQQRRVHRRTRTPEGLGGAHPKSALWEGGGFLRGRGGGGSGLCVPTEEGAGSAARRDAPGAERRRRRRDLQPFSGAAEAAGGRGRAARPRTRCSGDARRPPRTMAGLLPLLLLLLPAVSAGPGGGEGCSQVPGGPRALERPGKERGGSPGPAGTRRRGDGEEPGYPGAAPPGLSSLLFGGSRRYRASGRRGGQM